MFFLVPRIALLLIVMFGLILLWRTLRPPIGRRRGRRPARRSPFPLLPAALMRGADRTWVVFATPDYEPGRALVKRLRHAEPDSQVTEVDPRVEPRLAEAFEIARVPAVLRANRYGQVEVRLIGLEEIEAVIGPDAQASKRPYPPR